MAAPEPTKMRSTDRILVLSVMEGKKPLNTLGTQDPRLFSGENQLHAVMDTQSTLWRLKYDQGIIPPPLKGLFTSFKAILQHAREYYNKRNIEITEVKD